MALEVQITGTGEYGTLVLSVTETGRVRMILHPHPKRTPQLHPAQIECARGELRDALDVISRQTTRS